MNYPLRPLPKGAARLLPGLFQQRSELNRKYMLALKTENLLQNHYLEAGLWSPASRLHDIHWGWESPSLPAARPFPGPLAFGGSLYRRQHRRSRDQGQG